MHVSILSVCSFVGRLSSGKLLTMFEVQFIGWMPTYLILFRYRLRFFGKKPPCQSHLVFGCSQCRLSTRSDLCPHHWESSPSRFCFQPLRIGIWHPFWCVPVYCRRVIWYRRLEPKLGFHNTCSSCFIKCVQSFLWKCIWCAQCRGIKWRALLPRRSYVLPCCLLAHYISMLRWVLLYLIDNSLSANQ